MAERVRFGWEKLADILTGANVQDLILAYWEELSPVKDAAPLDVDWDWLKRMEGEGQLLIWTARVNGTLAGFIAFQVHPHFTSRRTLFAFDCGHYLAPPFRDNSRIGFRMWRTALAGLRAKGVRVVMAHDNAGRPLMPFFLALGFEPRSTIFFKVL